MLIASVLLIIPAAFCQSRDFQTTEKNLSALQKKLDRQTVDLVQRMEKQENLLQKKVYSLDSSRSLQLFAGTKEKYRELASAAQNPALHADLGMADKLRTYIPGVDSLQTALHFLQLNPGSLPVEKLAQLQALSSQLTRLQASIQVSGDVQQWLKERQDVLKQQLSNLPIGKQLTSINKESYYYQQRVAQVKASLHDKDKLKQTLLDQAARQPAFVKFWQKHSLLASMFPIAAQGDTATDQSLANLQSRDQVNRLIAQKLGTATVTPSQKAPDGQGYLSQQVQAAQSQLDALKNKARSYGLTGSSGNIVIPDFTPNNQKTKSFLKRLELGFNIQNTPSGNYLPATSNIAATVGYKLSDKVTIGTGIAYLLGWGQPVKDIHFSSQGIGLRSYADIKVKGSWWATGGFEYNYMNAFTNIQSLRDPDIWQKSALAGLTKKHRLGNKTVNLQLLYDFLARQQIPAPSPIKFRIGYSF